MISAFQSALSGLHAFGAKVQSNSNNIANASTNGFKQTRVILESTQAHGVKAQVEKINNPSPKVFQEGAEGPYPVELSNVDLGRELPEMYLNSQMYKANLKTLQTVDKMLGHLLETKS
jgi:flagellar hook protein FlgE